MLLSNARFLRNGLVLQFADQLLRNHRDLLEQLLVSDANRIAPYVNLPHVSAAYARLLRQPDQAAPLDVQYVWRSASLSLWLRQLQHGGSPT